MRATGALKSSLMPLSFLDVVGAGRYPEGFHDFPHIFVLITEGTPNNIIKVIVVLVVAAAAAPTLATENPQL